MRRLFSAALVALSTPLASACAPSPVTVELSFPNTDAFMRSEQARLRVFPLDPSPDAPWQRGLGACPALLDGLPTNSFPVDPAFDSQLTSVCAMRSGLELPDLGEGPHAYVIEVQAATTRRILQGCTVAEVYVDAPDIVVALHPTPDFDESTAAPGTPDSLCRGGGS
jgi:hypothetical protein